MLPSRDFWRHRRVLLTGHTGFKGAWAARLLRRFGASVVGIALAPPSEPSVFGLIGDWSGLEDHRIDLRDRASLDAAIRQARPEIVLHLAAQPIVRRSYRDPAETFDVNVTGTMNVLEALRGQRQCQAVLVVTSDKVYRNDDSGRPFVESDALGGDDPYSASKAAAEIVTASYRASGLLGDARIATARAGNVIGGGDFGEDRLIPDAVRAAMAGGKLTLRNPAATRPWQHVLDVVAGYLLFTEHLAAGPGAAEPALNFGPLQQATHPVRPTIERFIAALGRPLEIEVVPSNLAEKRMLSLDAARAARLLGWRPRLAFEDGIAWTAEWYREMLDDRSRAGAVTDRQIDTYLAA